MQTFNKQTVLQISKHRYEGLNWMVEPRLEEPWKGECKRVVGWKERYITNHNLKSKMPLQKTRIA